MIEFTTKSSTNANFMCFSVASSLRDFITLVVAVTINLIIAAAVFIIELLNSSSDS